jgi:hypothetical protein
MDVDILAEGRTTSAPQKHPTHLSHCLSLLGTWRLCERQVPKGKVMECSKAGRNVEC